MGEAGTHKSCFERNIITIFFTFSVTGKNNMNKKLIEGEDFYHNEMGYIVFTAKYHLEKGDCCGYGCLNCPYDYKNVTEEKYKELMSARIYAGKKEHKE
jgi:Family of unknown function (DUF5522)